MKKIMAAFAALLLLLTSIGCQTAFPSPDDSCQLSEDGSYYLCSTYWTSYFDTTISLSLYYTETDEYVVNEIYSATEALLATYHRYFDKYYPYEGWENIYTINHNGQTADGENSYGTTVIDPPFFEALEYVLAEQATITVGGVALFNIALSPVTSLWHDARESTACLHDRCDPPADEILNLTYNTDPADVILDETASTTRFTKPGMELDLGGFGKGYVSELITDRLDAEGITYLLNSGHSNIKAGGENPARESGEFIIALTKPVFAEDDFIDYFSYLRVPGDLSVVSSGSYQNFFIGAEDGIVYHHIIDPRTKHPGSGVVTLDANNRLDLTATASDAVLSVTILTENGAKGDILSTAVFLMTLAEGQAYVEATESLEAIWYLADGTIVLSSGLSETQLEVKTGIFKPLIILG